MSAGEAYLTRPDFDSTELVKEGLDWWNETFNDSPIPVDRVVAALKNRFDCWDSEYDHRLPRIVVKYFMTDLHDPTLVSYNSFCDFLFRFGPFNRCIKKCVEGCFINYSGGDEGRTVLPSIVSWFRADISKNEATKICRYRGEFVVRYRTINQLQDRFSLLYRSMNRSCYKWLHIYNSPEGYYCANVYDQNRPDKIPVFETLSGLINYYRQGGAAISEHQKWSTAAHGDNRFKILVKSELNSMKQKPHKYKGKISNKISIKKKAENRYRPLSAAEMKALKEADGYQRFAQKRREAARNQK